MASSAAQIHGLGVGSGISSTSSRKPSFSFAPRSVFFGQNLGKTTATFLKHTNNTSRRRYSTGPVRIVNEKVVGIDLGTTNSAVAAMEGGKPTIVTNAEGQRTTPSVVAYTKSGDRLVGQIAKRQAVVNPENTFFSVKRFIGRKMSEVDEESKQVSYKVVRDENGNVKLECPAIGKQFAAEEISAQVLRKLVDDASKFLNDKVTKAVVTRVVDWLAGNFKRDEGIDLLKDKQALQRLTETAEKAKMELSSLTQTNISLPFITATADGPKHIETTLTRAKFEELCSDLIDRLKTPVENSLRDAKLAFKDLDEVILVGGSTHEVVALGAAVQAGVLSGDVTAIDKGTGKKQDITITGASTLPSDEVERMVSEAEKFSKEDKEKRDAIDTKNQADSVVYQTEKQLKELGEKVPAPVKEKVEAKLQELKDAVAGGSTQVMKDAMAALNQEVMQLGPVPVQSARCSTWCWPCPWR
ncbi:HEAT SHOCK PROTEIN 70KDA [Salix viminalis]|uniref:HEAT SHOCK PROTEIN 70KDA n=1 Tax=Salix viminalis TaxID=40686 RepID=A0A9Q0TQ02_SALVM|nr:HEAT SHOCK PROTEIN 70KDA [Salix viminalis]